jgi:hypothetical protein
MATSDETSPTPTPPGSGDGYEFTPIQSRVFAQLATRMQFVGLFTLGTAFLAIVGGAWRHHLLTILSGMLYAVIGLWTERAGFSFRSVATTQGHDISHLMKALGDLHKLYTVQFWICIIALIVTLVVVGASAVY